MIKLKKLLESPDILLDPRNKKKYDLRDDNAITFGYDRHGDFLSKKNETGEKAITHLKIGIDSEDIKSYAGRLWEDGKIISFWFYPTRKEFNDILIHLQNKENIKFDSSWMVEIPVDGKELYTPFDETILIPIDMYYDDIINNTKEFIKKQKEKIDQHMKSPVTKDSDVIGKIGSKKRPSGLSHSQYHQMKSTSEQKINESPDGIYIDDKSIAKYGDKDSYAFGYNNKEPHVMLIGQNHPRIQYDYQNLFDLSKVKSDDILAGKRQTFKFPGRIWIRQKIITFWIYPNKKELNNIIKVLEKSLHIKINKDNWSIEVPVDFNKKDAEKYMEAGKYKLIRLSDYEDIFQGMKHDLTQQHTLSPSAKNQKVFNNIGSKKRPGGLSNIARKMMTTTSENKDK